MGFKLPGKSIQSGTSAHSSALKMKAEADASALKKKAYGATKSWEAGQKTSKEIGTSGKYNLDRWVKERSKHEKGSAEYNKYQNAINESLGSKVRHTKVTAGEKVRNAGENAKKAGIKSNTVSGKLTTQSIEEKDRKILGGTRRVAKTEIEDAKGKTNKKTVTIKDEKGNVKRKKSKFVTKATDEGEKAGITDKKTKLKTKYSPTGKKIKQKKVVKEGGRRTVTKTDAEGNVTTKSRRTLKGILTGKGKKEKE